MIGKWFTSVFGRPQGEPPQASNSNNNDQKHALEDLALIYEEREDWSKALETWDQVLEQQPNRLRALIGRGHVLTKQNLHDQAGGAYGDAALFESAEKIIAQNAPDNDEMREKADWFFRRHRWQEAFDSWSNILNRFPLSLEAALHIGQCLIELGETAQARSIYADLIEKFSHKAGPWRGLLRIGMYEQDWTLCDLAYEKCLTLGTQSVGVLKQCLDYKIERGAFADAENLVSSCFVGVDPLEAVVAQIKIEMARPNLPRALELIADGEQRFPDRGRRFRNKRSDCVASMGRFEDALKILTDNFEGMKAGAPAARRFIRACIEAGRIKKASRMINAIPEEWYFDRNLSSAIAWNFVMQGEPDHARQAWQRVPFRPNLQRRKDLQIRLNRVRWPETVSGEARLRLYCLLDAHLSDLSAFLDYYRAIGVQEFFLVDDGLVPSIREVVLQQTDCVLFENAGHSCDHCFGAYWINWLRASFAHEGWDLFVDQNSYLNLPDLGTIGLHAHLDLMEARDEEVLSAVRLFLYKSGSQSANDVGRQDDPSRGLFAFDSRVRLHNSLYCPYTADIRQYGKSITDIMDVQHICAPLLRSDADIQFLSGNHLTTPATVSSLRGALLDLVPIDGHEQEGEDWDNPMDQPGFVRYEGPEQLEVLGIVKRATA